MVEQTRNMRHHTRKGKSAKMRRQIQALRKLDKYLGWLLANGWKDSKEHKRVVAERKALEDQGVAEQVLLASKSIAGV